MSTKALSRAAFARHIGVSRSTVTRWGHAGRLVLNIDNQVLVNETIARLDATKGGRSDVAARHATQRGQSLPEPETSATSAPDEPEEEIDTSGDQRAEYRRQTIKAQTDLAKLEIALEEGMRLPLDLVRRESHALGGVIRQTTERLIDEIAPRLAATTNATERRQIIYSGIRSAKRTLIAEIRATERRVRTSARHENS